MLDVKPFFDYCVEEKCVENNYEATIKILYNLGYRTVAINQTVDVSTMDHKKKKKKGESREANVDSVPEPFKIRKVAGCENLTILNRLTVVFSNQDTVYKIIKSPLYKKYHIVGVLPTTLPATTFVCSSFEADIFCFNPESKNNIKRNRKMYKQLIDRGYHFELPYGPAIEDSTKRKHIIHMAHLYHSFFKSKNIIVSSGAVNNIYIRSPYDVINLGAIFGLNELQAKSAITHCARQVFINSVGRKHGKAVVMVENLEKAELASDSVICLESDEEMDTDQPALKKVKQ